MKKEEFIKLIETIQEFDKELDRWNDFGIEVHELPIAEIPWKIIDIIWDSTFTDDGRDWIYWWLYERISIINGEELPYYDENDVKHFVHTPEDLWELVKEYQI